MAEKTVNVDASTRFSFGFLRDNLTYILAGLAYLVVSLEAIRHRLDSIEEKLPLTWTDDNQRLFESELGRQNPAIKIPDHPDRRR